MKLQKKTLEKIVICLFLIFDICFLVNGCSRIVKKAIEFNVFNNQCYVDNIDE